jgi:excinuclease UvrABC helicase subunit UvrB
MYADSESDAMKAAIKETNRRREKQEKYNKENGIVPKTITKPIIDEEMDENEFEKRAYMISVDIPYWMYESGAAYTWTKKQGVHFSADMVEITDMSSYAENFIDFENCEPI